MPSALATARRDSSAAPCSASRRRASSLMAAVISILARARAPCGVLVMPSVFHENRAVHTNESTALASPRRTGHTEVEARAVLTHQSGALHMPFPEVPMSSSAPYYFTAGPSPPASTGSSAGWPGTASASPAPQSCPSAAARAGRCSASRSTRTPTRGSSTWSRRAGTPSGCATCGPPAAVSCAWAARCAPSRRWRSPTRRSCRCCGPTWRSGAGGQPILQGGHRQVLRRGDPGGGPRPPGLPDHRRG